MRLTLRTLLAYLDDTLDPTETKTIGQKVSESSQAQELIARIKEVVRRRRLATPPTSGPEAKLDANTVAEYIDSVLPAEKLTEVEEVCLQEDMYLAEVAACHQILTVVLSEPARVPPTAKRRMYSLIKGRESIHTRRATRAPLSGTYEAAEGAGDTHHHEDDEALLLGLPLYLRQGSWFRRLAPFAAVLLLLVVVAGIIWTLIPSEDEEVRVARNRPTAARTDENGKGQKADKARMEKAKESAVETKPEVKAETKPEPKPETKVETNTATPAAPAPAKPPEPQPEVKPETATGPSEPSGQRRVAGKLLPAKEEPAVLLQRRAEKEPWQRILAEGPVHTSDQLLSLPGYRSEIALPTGVRLVLWGTLPDGPRAFTLECAASLNDTPTTEVDADVTLDHGRLLIINDKPQGEVRVRVRFNNNKEIWNLSLLQPQTEIGLEVWGMYPPDVKFKKDGSEVRTTGTTEEKVEGPMLVAGMFLLKGLGNMNVRYDTWLLRETPGKNFFAWDNTGPAQREPSPLPADRMPAWTRKDAPAAPREARPLIDPKDVRAALDHLDKQLQGTSRVEEVIVDAVRAKEPRTFLHMLGTFCLGAIGDVSGLLEALNDERHRDVRLGAIAALQHWIGLRNDNDTVLYRALEGKFKGGSAEIIMSLLHGYRSYEDRLNPTTYETLIQYLANDNLPVRQMAIEELVQLAPEGRNIPYDPAGPRDQREQAFRKWRELIPDGSLPPSLRNQAPPARNP